MQVTDRRSVPEARTLPDRLAFKTAESASGQLLAIEDAEGIVTAIVSVTGTEDEVNDIIHPGAYVETLMKRRPKVCWAHSWEHPIGRVLHIEELMPGDDRLPTKTKDGSPWPREAGALVATMQFNMRSTEGKDAFEAVRFYSETGECEYSIGYNVPPGKSTKDRAGTRHIKALDLYELSVVLFGAHTMTGTISIKAALAEALERKTARGTTGTVATAARRSAKDALAAARQVKVEGKAAPPFTKADGDNPAPAKPATAPKAPPAADPGLADAGKDAAPDFSDGVMVAVYPDPAAADRIAQEIAGPDTTTPREDLHVTLAYLGRENEVSMTSDDLFKRVSDVLEGERGLTGAVGGIGMFPADENAEGEGGAPTWVPVDVVGLTMLREQIVEALGDAVATDHGFTPHMTIGYGLGLIDPLPEIPVTFGEVRIVYGTQSRSIPLGSADDSEGNPFGTKALDLLPLSEVVRLTAIESLRQQGTEGKAEGGADRNAGGAEKLRRYWTTGEGGAKIAWDTPGDFTRCVGFLSEHMTPENAKGYCANRHKEMTGMWPGDRDNKGYDPALETKESATPVSSKGYPRLPGSFEERQDALSAAVTEALRGEQISEEDDRWEWPGVCIEATFDDHLIASRYKWNGTDDRETYDMDYRFTPQGVDLGEPERVELEVVAVGIKGDDVDDVALGDIIPFAEDIEQITHAFKSVHVQAIQTKAGRVLSGANERRIRSVVENLVSVLAAAGVKISVDTTDDDDNTPASVTPTKKADERQPVDPAVDMTTTAPSASTKSAIITESDGTFILEADAVRAQIAALTEGL